MRFGSLSRGIRLGSGLAGRLVRLFGRWELAGFKFAACLLRHRPRNLGGRWGFLLVTLAEAGKIDTDFDGADEVDSRLNLIKGYGGALVREKIVAASSRRLVVLVGYEKIVKRLGDRGSLPVEVVPFGVTLVRAKLKAMGMKPRVRENAGKEFITDNGNLILDCAVKPIANAARLDRELLAIPGVVGTGLFIGMADIVLIAEASGKIRVLKR